MGFQNKSQVNGACLSFLAMLQITACGPRLVAVVSFSLYSEHVYKALNSGPITKLSVFHVFLCVFHSSSSLRSLPKISHLSPAQLLVGTPAKALLKQYLEQV